MDFVFSAVDMTKDEIRKIEEDYAKTETPVVSNNSAHRWTPDVHGDPGSEHRSLRRDRGSEEAAWDHPGIYRGEAQLFHPELRALPGGLEEFGPKEVVATTYQAISGAGKTFKDWPEMVENIIPYIGGEEEKSEQELCGCWATWRTARS